jgi:8-oxo-dGTP pyrophosphatase MutT (NUDIX family)
LLLWASLYVIGPVAQVNAEPPSIRATGCLIPTPKGIVMGINRLLGKIQLPMGRHVAGEDTRQTAARETLEETGIDVDVGALILTLEDNQVHLFLCVPKTPITDYSILQAKDEWEVSKVVVLDPHTMRNFDGTIITNAWRFPETRAFLKALFPSGENVNSPARK